MNYEEFKRELLEEVIARKPDVVEMYETTSVTKNNQHVREGISINYAGYENLRPTLYFEDHYDAYKAGVSVEEIAREITQIAKKEYENVKVFDLGNIDLEQAKENLSLRLLNKEWNKDMMQKCAYQEVQDLIAVPYLEVGTLERKASMLVNHDVQRQMFCMTDEEVLAVARENTMKQEYTIKGMTEMLREHMGNEFDEIYSEFVPEQEFAYVMTNNSKWYGAAGIMSKEVMGQIQEKLGEEMFFVMPSSVHETLIIPASDGHDPAKLQKMVKTVNEEQVEPHERLGENIYFYNGQKLQICNSQKEAMEQIEEKRQEKQEQTQTHGRRMG